MPRDVICTGTSAIFALMACLLSAPPASALTETGLACANDDPTDRAYCVGLIGATREASGFNAQRSACEPEKSQMAPTYAIMDWIKARPERQDEDLSALIDEALAEIDPCME